MTPSNSITPLVFVTGGVVSSLGKGLTSASVGMLLEPAASYQIERGPLLVDAAAGVAVPARAEVASGQPPAVEATRSRPRGRPQPPTRSDPGRRVPALQRSQPLISSGAVNVDPIRNEVAAFTLFGRPTFNRLA